MNRTTELEVLAATLEEPARALFRAAIVAQRQGRIDAAARVAADQCRKRPSLRWASLLLALEAAELRLAGSVALTTPSVRFAASEQYPLFEERWGAFGAVVYPAGDRLLLELVPGDRRTPAPLELVVTSLDGACSKDAVHAVRVLQLELEAHLGHGVRPIGSALR